MYAICRLRFAPPFIPKTDETRGCWSRSSRRCWRRGLLLCIKGREVRELRATLSWSLSKTAHAIRIQISVPAGRSTFTIVNNSDRALEWEILDGVMVLEERENIIPGFSQTLQAKLKAGDYEITCGLLNSPRGTLHVTPSAESDAEAARPALVAYLGPLGRVSGVSCNAGQCAGEGHAGARRCHQGGRSRKGTGIVSEGAGCPISRSNRWRICFADLHNAIDPVAEYLEKREEDPGFTGFHRIEYGLYAKNSTDGLAPIAAKLLLM